MVIEIKIKNSAGRDIVLYRPFGGSDLTQETVLQATVHQAALMLDDIKNFHGSQQQETYFGPMVLGGHATSTLIHEAHTAHLISGRYNSTAEATVYSDAEGKQVLPEEITIIDDPTLPNGYGSYAYDDEGVPAQKMVVVENGVIKELLHDRLSAGHMKKSRSNGHARSHQCQPYEPRMSNLIVQSSKPRQMEELFEMMKEEVIRKNLEYGLYIEAATQGEVEPDSGEVRIKPSKVWRVFPDDRPWQPVSGIFLVCEPLQTLNSIEAMGTEMEVDIGSCGADSGFIPVQHNCVPLYLKGVEARKATGHPDRGRHLPHWLSTNGNGDGDDDE